MRRMGASNEYFFQHNTGEAVFEMITPVVFKEEIDVDSMQRAATKAIRLYPELCYRPVSEGGGFFLGENDGEVVFLSEDKPLCLGSDETNGYLFYFVYSDKRLILRNFHGMADTMGLRAFTRTMLYFYTMEKGSFIGDDKFFTLCRTSERDIAAMDEGDMYDPYRKYADMEAKSPLVIRDDVFQFPDGSETMPRNHSHLYDVVVSTSEFHDKTKEIGTSFAPLVHLIVCDAMNTAYDMGEQTYVGMLPVDLRRFFDSKTLVNCSDSVFIPQTAADRREDIGTRCVRIRQHITDSLNVGYARALMGSKTRQVDSFEEMNAVNQAPGSAPKLPFTFGVTYPGASVMGGGIDEMIDDISAFGTARISMVSVSTFKDLMHFTYSMKTDNIGLVSATRDVLKGLGLNAELIDMGLHEKSWLDTDRF